MNTELFYWLTALALFLIASLIYKRTHKQRDYALSSGQWFIMSLVLCSAWPISIFVILLTAAGAGIYVLWDYWINK